MEYITNQDDRENEEYQANMLKYFELESFDEKQLTTCVVKLYNQIKKRPRYKEELHEIMKTKAATILSEDPVIGFMLFFSFDTYEVTYNTVQVLLTGSEEEWDRALEQFKEAIQK
jgi:hypothetical protein